MSQYVDDDILWKRKRACDAMKAKQRKDKDHAESERKKPTHRPNEYHETLDDYVEELAEEAAIAKAEGKFPPRGGAS